jgi:hypothetical protein
VAADAPAFTDSALVADATAGRGLRRTVIKAAATLPPTPINAAAIVGPASLALTRRYYA